jgi:hypothetical protein
MDAMDAMDKQTLGALVDGELDPEAAARAERLVARSPAARAYVERIAADRLRLARAFGEIAEEPLPPRLRALLDAPEPAGRPPAQVVTLRRRVPGWAGLGGLAAAAGVALAIFLGFGAGRDGVELATGPAPEPLAAALAALASGETRALGAGEIEMVASFPDARGGLCREFVLRGAGAAPAERAVACAAGTAWTVEVVAADTPPSGDPDAFLPAEGAGPEVIERTLDAIGAGLALTPEEEAAARARGWRP